MILRLMIWTLLILTGIIVAWYVYEGSWDRRLFTGNCHNLSAKEALAWLHEHPETQVLDVRSASEFTRGALPGAVNISLGDESFDSKVAAIDKTKPVLVYCAGGYRSRKAVERLKQLGFENIQHLHRGYMSWKPDSITE